MTSPTAGVWTKQNNFFPALRPPWKSLDTFLLTGWGITFPAPMPPLTPSSVCGSCGVDQTGSGSGSGLLQMNIWRDSLGYFFGLWQFVHIRHPRASFGSEPELLVGTLHRLLPLHIDAHLSHVLDHRFHGCVNALAL